MKKAFKVILMICAFALKTSAQIYFNNLYPFHSQVANASSVIELDSGGYLFKGCTFGSYSSLLIYKIDASGDTLFTKNYLKPLCSFSNGTSNSIIHTYDDNYAFSGSIMDATNNRDALIVKLTENGDTIWTKTFGGANFDVANTVCQTPDSGYVLMGVTQSFSNGPASDFYIVKVNKNGNFQWQNVYGTTAAEDCFSGQITLDGGFIMSGQQNNEFYIVKTDSSGNTEWQQTYSGTVGGCFVSQLADSSYILTGAKQISGFAGEAYMIKINKTGGLIWQNHYGDPLVNDWFYTKPLILTDGSIVVAGQQILGSVGIGMLVKTDSSGNQQWLRKYSINTAYTNYVYDVKHTSDNGFVLSGYVTHPWLVKVDSNGCEVAGCNVGVEEETMKEKEGMKIYPNPSNAVTTVEIFIEEGQTDKITIFNLLGIKLYEEVLKVGGNTIKIDNQNYDNGIYFYTLQDVNSSQVIDKQKVIISK